MLVFFVIRHSTVGTDQSGDKLKNTLLFLYSIIVTDFGNVVDWMGFVPDWWHRDGRQMYGDGKIVKMGQDCD